MSLPCEFLECARSLHITLLICPYIALSVKRKSDDDSMLFKNYWGSITRWWRCACLNLIIINVQSFPIVLRFTEALDVLMFLKKMFCVMSVLKFTFHEVASLLGDNLVWYFFYIKYIQVCISRIFFKIFYLKGCKQGKTIFQRIRCYTA